MRTIPSGTVWMGNTVSQPLLTCSFIDYFERLSSLLRDPVYYGKGVRRGAGDPVLLIPGFFAGDWMMAAMARWLARIGYRPYLSGIDWNVGCPDRKVELLGWRTQAIVRESGVPLVLVGHSLGGNAGARNRGSISRAGTPSCDAGHAQPHRIVGSDSARMAAGAPRCPVAVERARRQPAPMRHAAVRVRFRAALSTRPRQRGCQFHLHALRRGHRLAHLHRSPS